MTDFEALKANLQQLAIREESIISVEPLDSSRVAGRNDKVKSGEY